MEAVRVLVYTSDIGGSWIAQLVEYDIMVQSSTLDQLDERLQQSIANFLASEDKSDISPLTECAVAPPIFTTMWDEGEALVHKRVEFWFRGRPLQMPALDFRMRRADWDKMFSEYEAEREVLS